MYIENKALLENLPYPIFWKDTQSHYIGANKNFTTLLGISNTTTVKGMTDFDMPCSLEEAIRFREVDKKILQGSSLINKLEIRTYRDKTEKVIINKVPIVNHNKIVGIIGTHHILNTEDQEFFSINLSVSVSVNDNFEAKSCQELINLLQKIVDKALTKREVECLSLWVNGYSIKQNANYFSISERTVETHRNNIKEKIGFIHFHELMNLTDQKRLLKPCFLLVDKLIYVRGDIKLSG